MWVDIVALFFFSKLYNPSLKMASIKKSNICALWRGNWDFELRVYVCFRRVCVCVVVTLYIFIHPSILIKKPFKTEKGAVISLFGSQNFILYTLNFMMFVLSESSEDLPIHFAMQKVFGMTDIRNHTVFNKQSKLLNGRLPLHPIRKKQHTKMWIHKQ